MGDVSVSRLRLAAALERLADAVRRLGADYTLAFVTDEEARQFCAISMRHIGAACYGNEPVITDEECELFERLSLRYEKLAAEGTATHPDPAGTSTAHAH